MQTSKWFAIGLCVALVPLTGCAKLQSRDQMNKGVQAFKNNHYAEAVKHFQQAVQLDPTNQNAQLYLATSYMIQWVPGAESPDNKKNYDAAQREFQKVLKEDPKNSLALADMASMAFQSATGDMNQEQKVAALENARKWNDRRVEVDPKDGEAYYYLGVIDYAEAFGPLSAARVAEKCASGTATSSKNSKNPKNCLTPDSPGPLLDKKVREDLKAKYENTINQGLDDLKKTLQYDKENEDAMSYINLLLREKALLSDTPDEAKADSAEADNWMNKSLEEKRIKASRPQKTQAT
jgi:tetratricopeptide (TPR) repeat protein